MKKNLTKNIGWKLLSVLLAVLTWFVVVNQVDPIVTTTISGIEVEILNPEAITGQGKVFEVTGNKTISIRVNAKKTDLGQIRATDFHAYVDMRYSYGTSENQQAAQIRIEVVNNRSIIDESSIEFRGEDVLYFTTENVTSRSIPVEIDQSGELGDTYHLENLACTPSEVTVTAPESVMAKVSKVVAQIDLYALNSDTSEITAAPKVLDANGDEVVSDDLTISSDSVTISASLLHTSRIPISVAGVSGTPADGYQYRDYSLSEDSVVVAGPRSELSNITNILIPAERLSVDGAQGDTTVSINLTEYLPEGVQIVDGSSTLEVKLSVEAMKTRQYAIETKNINLENQSDQYEYLLQANTVSVSLTALGKDLDILQASQLVASIDVGGYGPGTYRLPVSLALSAGYTLKDTPMTAVVIKEKGTTTPSSSVEESTEDTTQESKETETEEATP